MISGFFIITFFSSPTARTMAHGGDLNSDGCHDQNSDNTYHCHQGTLAGQIFVSREQARKESTTKSVATEIDSKYQRDNYLSSWQEADRNCINTRHEVLIDTFIVAPIMSKNRCVVEFVEQIALSDGEYHELEKELIDKLKSKLLVDG